VPVELTEATKDEIRLGCTLAEFGRLDPAEETELMDGGYGGGYGQAEAVQGDGNVGGMGVGGSVSGMGIGMGLGHRTPLVVEHADPLGETEVGRHESVHAVDGPTRLDEASGIHGVATRFGRRVPDRPSRHHPRRAKHRASNCCFPRESLALRPDVLIATPPQTEGRPLRETTGSWAIRSKKEAAVTSAR
jgi:hypothetical protein